MKNSLATDPAILSYIKTSSICCLVSLSEIISFIDGKVRRLNTKDSFWNGVRRLICSWIACRSSTAVMGSKRSDSSESSSSPNSDVWSFIYDVDSI
jgi:hypothetical protein